MITVKFGGIYKDRVAKKYKKGIKLEAKSIAEIIEALNQDSIFSDDLVELLRTYKASFVLGRSVRQGRPLAPEQAAGNWLLCPAGEDVTLQIVPIVHGGIEVTMAQIIFAVVMTAISIGVNLLMSVLFPMETSSGGNKRKSALYENGLQTQREHVPLAYVAGRRVWCGFNVIEADVDVTATGGSSMIHTDSHGNVSGGSGLTPGWDHSLPIWLNMAFQGAGGGGGKQRDNNLFSTAILRILGTPGAGPLKVVGNTFEEQQKHVYFNEVPWRDPGSNQLTKNGVSMTTRDGVPGQSAVPITPGISNNFNASQDLQKRDAFGTLLPGIVNSVTSHEVHRVKIRIALALLFTGKKGDQYDTDVKVGVDVKRASSSTWISRGTWTIKGKTSDPVQRQINVFAPEAGSVQEPWQFRVYRVTEDSDTDKLENTTKFNGWTEIIDKELTYDGSDGGVPTALLGFQIDLAEFDATSPPEIATLMEGVEVDVPLGYDDDTQTYPDPWLGAWERKRTVNPVWHLRNMACNSDIGLGFGTDAFNKFDLLPIAKFCDQKVNGRRRYTMNEQFSDEEDGWQVLVEVAQSMGAMIYWNGYNLKLVQDRPTGKVDTYINNSDVEGRSFAYSYVPLQEAVNEITAKYADPDNFGKFATVTYRDEAAIARCKALGLPNGGRINRTVVKRSCNNRQEAYDWARKLVWDAQNEPLTVTWKTTLKACRYLPGWIAEVDDERRAKAHRGRIASIIDKDNIRLDRPLEREAYEAYDLRSSNDGGYTKIRLPLVTTDTNSTDIYVPDHGLEATLGVGISKPDDKAPQTYRIIGIADAGKGLLTVTAKQHEERKYAILDGIDNAPIHEWPSLDFKLAKPTGLKVSHTSKTDDITGNSHTLLISWNRVTGQLRNYHVQVMGPDDGNYVTVYAGSDTSIRVPNAMPGIHRISVTPINTMGASFEPATTNYLLDYNGTSSLKAPILLGLD